MRPSRQQGDKPSRLTGTIRASRASQSVDCHEYDECPHGVTEFEWVERLNRFHQSPETETSTVQGGLGATGEKSEPSGREHGVPTVYEDPTHSHV